MVGRLARPHGAEQKAPEMVQSICWCCGGTAAKRLPLSLTHAAYGLVECQACGVWWKP